MSEKCNGNIHLLLSGATFHCCNLPEKWVGMGHLTPHTSTTNHVALASCLIHIRQHSVYIHGRFTTLIEYVTYNQKFCLVGDIKK